jgi:dTMP kinase
MASPTIEFMPGKLMYLEGVDGSGKSVHTKWITANSNALYAREPGSTAINEELRDVVKDPNIPLTPRQQAAIFMASRGLFRHETLTPAIANGQTFFGDRSWLSTAVYQGCEGVDVDDIYHWAGEAMGPFQFPDLMIILSQPAEVSLARLRLRGTNISDRYKTRGIEYTRAIVDGYRAQIERWRDIGKNIVEIDSNRPISEVREDILAACSHLMISRLDDGSIRELVNQEVADE